MKVIKFPVSIPAPFGPQRVRGKKGSPKTAQLNLFAGAKVVSLSRQSVFDEAMALEEAGDEVTARERYLACIDREEAVADAYCNLGILEYRQGNGTKAADYFTLALREDPRHFESHYNLANLYSELGNLALAKVHYRIAIEVEPTFSNSYFNLALTLALNKETDEAIATLGRFCQLAPADEQATAVELMDKLRS